jgi:subtilisin family serine protease
LVLNVPAEQVRQVGKPEDHWDLGGEISRVGGIRQEDLRGTVARLRSGSGPPAPATGRAPLVARDLPLSVPELRGAPQDAHGEGVARPVELRLRQRSNSRDGAGVLIGLPETGIRAHSWLYGGILAAPDDVEALDADLETGLEAQAGHGTFIAGLILQQAQAAGVIVEKTLDTSGYGETSDVIDAVLRLARRGVQIINLSLGAYPDDPDGPDAPDYGDTSPYGDVITDVVSRVHEINKEAVVVAAAGNLLQQDGKFEEPRPFYPAADAGVVAVAALAEHGNALAEWSNRGEWVSFAAPGEHLMSTYLHYTPVVEIGESQPVQREYRGWARWSGTSFAAAVVSGAIARTMTQQNKSAREAKDYLCAIKDKTVDGGTRSKRHVIPVVEAVPWKPVYFR